MDADSDVASWIDGFDKDLHTDLESRFSDVIDDPIFTDLLAMIGLDRCLLLLSEASRREPMFLMKVVQQEQKARGDNDDNIFALTVLSRLWAIAKTRLMHEVFSLASLDQVDDAINAYVEMTGVDAKPSKPATDSAADKKATKPTQADDTDSNGDNHA